MRFTMKERKAVTKLLCDQYRKSDKTGKMQILNQFVEATGYNRHYAAWLLRQHGRRVRIGPQVAVQGDVRLRARRHHARKYDDEVLQALKKLWELLDFISSRRVHAALPEVIPRLVAFRELRIKKSVQKRLLEVSPATIDRMLKQERKKYTLKGRATTKPGTLLKHQIPIRTFSDWDNEEPGFLEMDLVGHDGGRVEGDYCFTLDITDVATGWSEQAAVQNKAQKWVFEALVDLGKRLPFAIRGLDSDNGGEFINNHMVAYCSEQHITFTRSRPYRKNDSCYVEQKNWSIVRRHVGYARYETPEQCRLLNELYRILHDYNNFFMPSMKLVEKIRNGTKVTKHYDTPKTPYTRVLQSNKIPKAVKDKLRRYYDKLNPAELKRRIEKLQKMLARQVAENRKRKAVA